MNSLLDRLQQLDTELAQAVSESTLSGAPRGTEHELVGLLQVAGRIRRRIEGVLVDATGDVHERSQTAVRDERMTSRFGCRSTSELLQRTTLCDASTASRLERAARATHRDHDITSGALLPGRYPALHSALRYGAVGLDGFLAATGPLVEAERRIGVDDRLRADAELAASARGVAVGVDAGAADAGEGDAADADTSASDVAPPATADDLRMLSRVIVAYLDQDGAQPERREALHKRGVTLGTSRDGLVPLHARLLPEVVSQFLRIADSLLNPKGERSASGTSGVMFRPSDEAPADLDPDEPTDPIDDRTRAQKMHDVFATALSVAARAGELPTIGGAAPTLVVTVRAEDFAAGTGIAQAEGVDEPASMNAARQVACCGNIQRVLFDDTGRIVGITTSDRVFNAWQRRAIVARDKKCVIPGCHVPASWCELHHVHEHRRGGATHTDNGVPLCWHHHRTLERSGWEIRMVDGLPQVRGPSWWDPQHRWRPVSPGLALQR